MKIEDLKGIVPSDPEIMGGTPVFVGTRMIWPKGADIGTLPGTNA